VIARQPTGRGLAEVAEEAGASVLVSAASLKAALDLDWDDPEERGQALVRVLEALDAVEEYLDGSSSKPREATTASLRIARRVRKHDVEELTDGARPTLRCGVARERLVSVEDPQMRHGRKSRRQRFDGYKRHVLRDLDTGLVRAVGVTPANAPEASVTEGIAQDLAYQADTELKELHIDRAYLSSEFW
jgi:hypothetical protein